MEEKERHKKSREKKGGCVYSPPLCEAEIGLRCRGLPAGWMMDGWMDGSMRGVGGEEEKPLMEALWPWV